MDASLHIVGVGGIGCAVGYALRAAGVDVTLVDADDAKVCWGRQHGVQVDRHPPLAANFQTFADWSPPSGAIVLLGTKCYDNAGVLAKLPADVSLVPIQNGFDRSLDNELEGIASFVSECLPQRSHTRITRRGKLHLGYRHAHASPFSVPRSPFSVLRSSAFGRLGIRVEIVSDILPYKYTKLMYNAAISPLAAAAGLDNGELLWVPAARRLFFQLLRENYAILRQAGTPLARIGPFHPNTVSHILRRPMIANALAWAFYPTLKGSYCSMSSDLPKGRTEIDYYNCHLIDLAGNGGCPLNRRLVELVKRMERDRIPPSLTALEELTTGTASPQLPLPPPGERGFPDSL